MFESVLLYSKSSGVDCLHPSRNVNGHGEKQVLIVLGLQEKPKSTHPIVVVLRRASALAIRIHPLTSMLDLLG